MESVSLVRTAEVYDRLNFTYSSLAICIRSLSKLPPRAMTKTSTSVVRGLLDSDSMRAFMMLKIRSTPKEMPTQGICDLLLNILTRLSSKVEIQSACSSIGRFATP